MSTKTEVRTVNVTRYVTPLREGGSLPAIAEADEKRDADRKTTGIRRMLDGGKRSDQSAAKHLARRGRPHTANPA